MYQNKKSLLVFSLSLLLLMISFYSAYAKGPTYVSGHLSKKNMVWNPGYSPYIITGNTYVEDGSTLRILPGVQVLFYPDTHIFVRGRLIVQGNKNQKVLFSLYQEISTDENWGSIVFKNGVGNIDNAKIEFARSGIIAERSQVTISNCEITNSQESGIFLDRSSGYIDGNLITSTNWEGLWSNSFGIRAVNWEQDTSRELTIINNRIIDNNPNEVYDINFKPIELGGSFQIWIYNNRLEEYYGDRAIVIDGQDWAYPIGEINNNTIIGGFRKGITVKNVFDEDNPLKIHSNSIRYERDIILPQQTYKFPGLTGIETIGAANVEIINNTLTGWDLSDRSGEDHYFVSRAIAIHGATWAIIERNRFFHNNEAIKHELTAGSAATIRYNEIAHNNGAFNSHNWTQYGTDIPFTVEYNNIYENKETISIFIRGDGPFYPVHIESNWWGTIDRDAIINTFCCGPPDTILPYIIFEPFALNPFLTSGHLPF